MYGTRQTAVDQERAPRPSWRQLGMVFSLLLSAILVLFHAALLWERIRDQSIFQPLVAIEWTAGVLLLAALRQLQRNRVPLLRGRKALAFWLLVLLLHLIAAPPGAESLTEPGGLLLALPATWLILRWIASAIATWAARIPRSTALLVVNRRRGSPPEPAATLCGHAFRLFARPPPFLPSS